MKKTLLIAIALCCLTKTQLAQYSNLVMEGAGIRGIAYTGALKVLEEKQVITKLQRVAGTSVGAIVGALLSVGYSAEELKKIIAEKYRGIVKI